MTRKSADGTGPVHMFYWCVCGVLAEFTVIADNPVITTTLSFSPRFDSTLLS